MILRIVDPRCLTCLEAQAHDVASIICEALGVGSVGRPGARGRAVQVGPFQIHVESARN